MNEHRVETLRLLDETVATGCRLSGGAIGFVTLDERQPGHDVLVLLARRNVYTAARQRHADWWSRHVRHRDAPAAMPLDPRGRNNCARAAEGLRIGASPKTSMVRPSAPKTANAPPRHHAESASQP
jgi:hypothetical protein